MPSQTAEQQLQFIMCCIKHSENGKVDFAKVALKCDIISKGAAAKRYERLMKQYDINPAQSSPRDAVVASNPKKRSKDASKGNVQEGEQGEIENYRSEGEPKQKTKKRKSDDDAIKHEPLGFDGCYDADPYQWTRHDAMADTLVIGNGSSSCYADSTPLFGQFITSDLGGPTQYIKHESSHGHGVWYQDLRYPQLVEEPAQALVTADLQAYQAEIKEEDQIQGSIDFLTSMWKPHHRHQAVSVYLGISAEL
ncbi:hypothetical protein MMC25_000832 [Agyrium rufum]|nr:hypothetical protein [Agyrium rufum]